MRGLHVFPATSTPSSPKLCKPLSLYGLPIFGGLHILLHSLIPVAIIGAKHFYSTFVNIINIIGYWSTIFSAIVIAEHLIFRRNDWSLYDLSQWCTPRQLPPGLAALLAFLCGCGIVVPCMSQAWYEGPIAAAGTGDIGIIVSFVLTLIVYPVFRAMEKSVFHGR